DWAQLALLAKLSYNNRIYSSTQYSHFMLDCSQHLRLHFESVTYMTFPAADQFVKDMKEAEAEAESVLRKAADEMAKFYDWKRSPATPYYNGDLVRVSAKNI
ncbi:hypothetical protein BT69DRAFT_1192353, partial [Atractiella rhizophila]